MMLNRILDKIKIVYQKVKKRLFGKLCECKPKKRGRPRKDK
jgi:hypothetical protein